MLCRWPGPIFQASAPPVLSRLLVAQPPSQDASGMQESCSQRQQLTSPGPCPGCCTFLQAIQLISLQFWLPSSWLQGEPLLPGSMEQCREHAVIQLIPPCAGRWRADPRRADTQNKMPFCCSQASDKFCNKDTDLCGIVGKCQIAQPEYHGVHGALTEIECGSSHLPTVSGLLQTQADTITLVYARFTFEGFVLFLK